MLVKHIQPVCGRDTYGTLGIKARGSLRSAAYNLVTTSPSEMPAAPVHKVLVIPQVVTDNFALLFETVGSNIRFLTRKPTAMKVPCFFVSSCHNILMLAELILWPRIESGTSRVLVTSAT
jgi:hypothetical protein